MTNAPDLSPPSWGSDGVGAVSARRYSTPAEPTTENPRTYIAYGKPAPQGSKTRNKFGGVRDDNAERLEPWRNAVMGAVFAAEATRGRERIEGPVAADLTFTFDKPKSAPKTRAIYPVTRATFDADKLVRACFDALTAAGAWRDDSQVVEFAARKVFVGDEGALLLPGVRIIVWPVS